MKFDKTLGGVMIGTTLLFVLLIASFSVVKTSGLEEAFRLAEMADYNYWVAVGESEGRILRAMEKNPEEWTIKTKSRPRETAITVVEEALSLREKNRWCIPFYKIDAVGERVGIYVAGVAMLSFLIRGIRGTIGE